VAVSVALNGHRGSGNAPFFFIKEARRFEKRGINILFVKA
jgi:hypothetical protein